LVAVAAEAAAALAGIVCVQDSRQQSSPDPLHAGCSNAPPTPAGRDKTEKTDMSSQLLHSPPWSFAARFRSRTLKPIPWLPLRCITAQHLAGEFAVIDHAMSCKAIRQMFVHPECCHALFS